MRSSRFQDAAMDAADQPHALPCVALLRPYAALLLASFVEPPSAPSAMLLHACPALSGPRADGEPLWAAGGLRADPGNGQRRARRCRSSWTMHADGTSARKTLGDDRTNDTVALVP